MRKTTYAIPVMALPLMFLIFPNFGIVSEINMIVIALFRKRAMRSVVNWNYTCAEVLFRLTGG